LRSNAAQSFCGKGHARRRKPVRVASGGRVFSALGRCALGAYFWQSAFQCGFLGADNVADNSVILTDSDGQPVGSEKRHLNSGDDARLIACGMVRARRRSSTSVRPEIKFSR
jgi:hypothetical protein